MRNIDMTSPTKSNPVIFIHGLWIHSAAWAPWIELFESRGYSASAPGWPGDAPTVADTRANADALNDQGLAEIFDHYAELIGTPEVKPIVVGHSFGGLIAEELLANNVVAAAVAIDPAGVKGVKALPFAQLKSAFPVLSNPANLHRTVSLNAKQFHYGFGNTLTEEESDALHEAWTIPGARQAAVRGCQRQLLPALPGQGRHPPGRPRTAAADLGHRRPHRPAQGHQGSLRHVRQGARRHRIPRLRRQGTFLDHRQRLERGRRRGAQLACRQGLLISRTPTLSPGKSNAMTTILVTTANGDTGRPMVDYLLQEGFDVRAMVRKDDDRAQQLRDKGVEVVFGDLLGFRDVRKALDGVQRAYFNYPVGEGLVEAAVMFAQAAKEQSLELIVNMSHIQSRPYARSKATQNHWLSEQIFDWSGVPTTHLRITFFMQWLLYVSELIRYGRYAMPYDADSRFAPIAGSDIALTAAKIFTSPEEHGGRTYTLTGPVEYSHEELAAEVSRVLGNDPALRAGHRQYVSGTDRPVRRPRQAQALRGRDHRPTRRLVGRR